MVIIHCSCRVWSRRRVVGPVGGGGGYQGKKRNPIPRVLFLQENIVKWILAPTAPISESPCDKRNWLASVVSPWITIRYLVKKLRSIEQMYRQIKTVALLLFPKNQCTCRNRKHNSSSVWNGLSCNHSIKKSRVSNAQAPETSCTA